MHKDVIKVANLQLWGGGFIPTPTKTCFCFITPTHAQKYLVHLRSHTCQSVCFPKSHTQARSGLPSNSYFSKPYLSRSTHHHSLSLSPSLLVMLFLNLLCYKGNSEAAGTMLVPASLGARRLRKSWDDKRVQLRHRTLWDREKMKATQGCFPFALHFSAPPGQ